MNPPELSYVEMDRAKWQEEAKGMQADLPLIIGQTRDVRLGPYIYLFSALSEDDHGRLTSLKGPYK